MTIFLSGSITADPEYKEHFKKANEHFTSKNFSVFDPSRLPPDWPYEKYIRVCLKELPTCDAIYYVNDVTTSKGSFIERIVAQACGIVEITDQTLLVACGKDIPVKVLADVNQHVHYMKYFRNWGKPMKEAIEKEKS